MTVANETVKIGDEDVNLADIAGVNMDDVTEFRFQTTPAGLYQWRVMNAELGSFEVNAGTPNAVKKPTCKFELEATNCFGLANDSKDPADGIGQKHNEMIFITDLEKDIGRIKALMVDSGFTGSGTLQELLDQYIGHEFIAAIKQRKDKNDADRVYANIDFSKVRPLDAAA